MALSVPFRVAAAAAVTALALNACGGSDSKDPSDDPASEAASLVKKANKAMKETTFQSSGSTTAFEGAEQVTTWDPEKGLRMTVSGDKDIAGESYCKDGTNYLSAGLLSASLAESGQDIDVPDDLSDTFVHTDAGDTCDAFFRIPDTAERAKDKDGKVDGQETNAVSVSQGGTDDVYYIAASGKPYILKMESERDGRKSTTTYQAFGEKTDVTMPSKDESMPLDEFQEEVLPQ